MIQKGKIQSFISSEWIGSEFYQNQAWNMGNLTYVISLKILKLNQIFDFYKLSMKSDIKFMN